MTPDDLVEAVAAAGGILSLEGDSLRFCLPKQAAHLVPLLRERKPDVLAVVRERGGRVAAFPHCPRCASYALYRKDDIGAYECLTCGLKQIEEATARSKR